MLPILANILSIVANQFGTTFLEGYQQTEYVNKPHLHTPWFVCTHN